MRTMFLRWGISILVVVAGGAVAVEGAPSLPSPADLPVAIGPLASSGGLWIPTFDDEFSGSEVDGSKWSNGFGWGDTAANFAGWCDPGANAVGGGALVQRADRVAGNGKPYSAACLHTRGTFDQRFGYWEARIRVPAGVGLHSAFWGKPADESWPPELDVEEITGGVPATVIMTNHWRDASGHRQRNRRHRGEDFSAGYHVFGAEWSPVETVWYVDGVERFRLADGAAEMAAGGPFYALLDLQVGLRGAARPDATTPWPAYQFVDYVRIFERPLGMFTG